MRRLSSIGKTTCIMMVGFLCSIATFAQDSIRSNDIDIENSSFDQAPFYAQLWFWIVIGMVFLLLLIALLRGNGGKKKEENGYVEDKLDM